MLQVGQVARQLNLNPQTLYFYERIGLIPPPHRSEGGYRLFSPEDVERLAFIGRAKTLGLSLEEIKEILALKDGRSLTCQALYEHLTQKLRDIEAQMEQLQALHGELAKLAQRCQTNLQKLDQQCVVLDQSPDLV
ncbi:heavy metal-responsive transcriptional regulator [Spirulina subsalsa]|uniref:heavy metal-responsive transcriptional regulator n=1 Tax=Spirulina subsalsa TaxID=54311 RepID=UPI0002D58150|nr:heavy metal-responsive transcriptional regulator [Spirulina subsalsa]